MLLAQRRCKKQHIPVLPSTTSTHRMVGDARLGCSHRWPKCCRREQRDSILTLTAAGDAIAFPHSKVVLHYRVVLAKVTNQSVDGIVC